MNEKNYIVDEEVPLSQNFNELKNAGLDFVQKYSKGEWTNFNPSDPGVTILDQVCYALTELGYCNDFPIEDILTGPDGKLKIHNQFYLPETILTTSPLTINDYRKYLIDAIKSVYNVVILKQPRQENNINGIYNTYLLIDPAITDCSQIENILKSALYQLNKSRNLGEIFNLPIPLNPTFRENNIDKEEIEVKENPNEYLISGSIEIAKLEDLSGIVSVTQDKINNYIFPRVIQSGYDVLADEGLEMDEILNGPVLTNGWIKTSSLGVKKDFINSSDMINLFLTVSGVISAPNLSFWQPGVGEESERILFNVECTESELLVFNVRQSIEDGSNNRLKVYCNGSELSLKTIEAFLPPLEISEVNASNINSVASTVLAPPLPEGRFRDINSYYSIQNTFPESYAVGEDSTPANASDFQIAQSRQLKGYLTLFDQVMANQFSQLANVFRLFAFDNSLTGTPSDLDEFYELKNAYEQMHLKYPVPYLVFSPTYFYQSLYEVPYIKPLLKNNDALSFSYKIQTKNQSEIESWDKYKDDPYNAYIRGLMDFMEADSDSLIRRDHMTDHLLARYGYSPAVINDIIEGSKYTGEAIKDKVIYKSLLLQNLGLLSYYRQKAYNYLGAISIDDSFLKLAPINPNIPVPEKYYEQLKMGYTVDFIFDSTRVDRIEKLKEVDFINYSALELNLNLLLGLRIQYEDFIVNSIDCLLGLKVECNDTPNEEKRIQIMLAYWMITMRKGIIAIEKNLLFQSLNFDNQEESIAPYDDTNPNVIENEVLLYLPDFIPQFESSAFRKRFELQLASSLPVQVIGRLTLIDSDQLGALVPAFIAWHNSLIFNSDINIANSAKALIEVIDEFNLTIE